MEPEVPTHEQFMEAIDTLSHHEAFNVLKGWLKGVIDDQVVTVAQGGTDTHRQYMETGVLQALMRVQDALDITKHESEE